MQLAYRPANRAGLTTSSFWDARRPFLFIGRSQRRGIMALLYRLATVAFGLNEPVVAGFAVFPRTIRRGEFDRGLRRRVSASVGVLAPDLQFRRLGGSASAWWRWRWSPGAPGRPGSATTRAWARGEHYGASGPGHHGAPVPRHCILRAGRRRAGA
jgi:hypothetical protein